MEKEGGGNDERLDKGKAKWGTPELKLRGRGLLIFRRKSQGSKFQIQTGTNDMKHYLQSQTIYFSSTKTNLNFVFIDLLFIDFCPSNFKITPFRFATPSSFQIVYFSPDHNQNGRDVEAHAQVRQSGKMASPLRFFFVTTNDLFSVFLRFPILTVRSEEGDFWRKEKKKNETRTQNRKQRWEKRKGYSGHRLSEMRREREKQKLMIRKWQTNSGSVMEGGWGGARKSNSRMDKKSWCWFCVSIANIMQR